jgi:hypothetical protein
LNIPFGKNNKIIFYQHSLSISKGAAEIQAFPIPIRAYRLKEDLILTIYNFFLCYILICFMFSENIKFSGKKWDGVEWHY